MEVGESNGKGAACTFGEIHVDDTASFRPVHQDNRLSVAGPVIDGALCYRLYSKGLRKDVFIIESANLIHFTCIVVIKIYLQRKFTGFCSIAYTRYIKQKHITSNRIATGMTYRSQQVRFRRLGFEGSFNRAATGSRCIYYNVIFVFISLWQ